MFVFRRIRVENIKDSKSCTVKASCKSPRAPSASRPKVLTDLKKSSRVFGPFRASCSGRPGCAGRVRLGAGGKGRALVRGPSAASARKRCGFQCKRIIMGAAVRETIIHTG